LCDKSWTEDHEQAGRSEKNAHTAFLEREQNKEPWNQRTT
jgi:hypothetical protein